MSDITRDAHKAYFNRIVRNSVYEVVNKIKEKRFPGSKTITIIVLVGIGRWSSCFV